MSVERRRARPHTAPRLLPYLLLAPSLLVVLAVMAFPIADLFYISAHTTRYLRVEAFSGLQNFAQLGSPSGAKSILATVEFVLGSVALVLIVAFALAILLEAPLRGRGVLRTVIILPWLVSQVVTALIWQALLDPNFGPLSEFVRVVFGLDTAPLADQGWAVVCLVVANVWRSYPLALVLLLAAVQTVPDEQYEAARLDGASRWQEFRHVLLPNVAGTLRVVAVILTFESFAMVSLPMIMTGGGPAEATYVLSLRVWRQAFAEYRFGASAATGTLVFLCNLGLSIYYVRNSLRAGARVP